MKFDNKQYICLKDQFTQNGNSNELRDLVFEEILPEMINDFTPLDKTPKAIILGGLSGAGKSGLRNQVLKNIETNFIKIDTDDLRDKLPDNEDINLLYGDEASSITQPDAGLAGVYIRNHCLMNRYSYLVDSTLRTVDNAKIEISKAIANNFTTEVHLLAVSEYEALQGVFQRYLIQKEAGKNARFVEPDFIKESYKTISLSVKEVNNHNVDEFKIYNRKNEILYDKNVDFDLVPENIFKNQNQNFIKNLSANDAKEFLDEWNRIKSSLYKLNTNSSIIKKLENEKVNFCDKFLQNSMISRNIKFSIVKKTLSKSPVFFSKVWNELNTNIENNNIDSEKLIDNLKIKYSDNFVNNVCKLKTLSHSGEIYLDTNVINKMTFNKIEDMFEEYDFKQVLKKNIKQNINSFKLK